MGFLRKRLQRVGMSRGSANLLLALCTMFWGMSYVMNKIAGAGVPPLEVMAIRYTLAGLLCVPLFRRRLARATARTWRYGIILGLIAFVSSLGIFYGLLVTEASTAAFLTSTAFVFVPLLQTLRHRQLPEPVILLCTGMAAVGIALLSLKDGLHLSAGALLCLAGGVLYAVFIILTDDYAHKEDGIVLGVIQIIVMSVMGILCTILLADPVMPQGFAEWGAILCLTLFCSAFAFIAQPFAQAFTTPENTAVIFSMEPVFGSFYAFLILGEWLSLQGIFGACLVLASVLIVSLHGTSADR